MSKIKKDKFFRDRDGVSQIWRLSCVKCGEEFMLYQKDGRGSLHRTYLNRILAPAKLADLQDTAKSVKDLSALHCQCGALVGIPMLHREGRLAFRLIHGAYKKSICPINYYKKYINK